MEQFKLSFIVPCYNGFDKLTRLVACFKNLKLHPRVNFEVIIIDDGSDSDYEGSLGENFFLYKKRNGGVSSARNYGLDKADGDYVIFIDSDDLIVENTLDLIYEEVLSNISDVFIFSHFYINNKKITKKINHSFSSSSELALKEVFTKKVRFHNCAMVYKKEFLSTNNLKYSEELKYSEDVYFILSSINKSSRITVSEKVFYHYIDNEDGVINQSFDKRMLNQIETFNLIKEIKVPTRLNVYLNYFILTCVCHSLVRAYKAKVCDDDVFEVFVNFARAKRFPYFITIDKHYIFCFLMKLYLHFPMKLLTKIKRLTK
ncbi:glycosyltransferase family 2 protein [uncultured Pseudoalteromonas sp.]|uniref:glycosyltransferase family 2 protein n=1 Tax=uncultured Pseudoalteromonas sp. TaxID=114053 RepID=UPI0025993733|nr:glycosyltransferase family 2 protein [uncultured Pseudoalteromonas sp.]|tara:strand:+ start:19289 stop:20236 length:948 start_codon:yes stop_codon:yes gene_type:complete